MQTENTLAAASLVFSALSLFIASTALVVALGQLLQAALGRAGGWRRCDYTIIGPWSKLRRYKPNFFELRVEVEYSTPRFMLLSSDKQEWRSVSDTFGYTYDLATLSGRGDEEVEQHKSVLRSNTGQQDNARIIGPRKTEQRSWFQIRKRKERNRVETRPVDPEKNAILVETKHIPKPKRPELLVSWLSLIDAVHRTYESYATKLEHVKRDERGQTIAAVAIRQWNWDFMPPDLIRPLATSTLNNLILFALRLNMVWRRFDLETGVFLADGNGYSLSSTDVRGLGIAFNFTSTGRHNSDRIMAPTENVDKSCFGIIPGCKTLVQKDISYINDKGNYWFNNIFIEIGIEDAAMRERLSNKLWVEQRYDAIILLSKFIPIPGCPLLFNFFPGCCTTAPTTPLHYFEGRIALMDALEERIGELSNQKHKAIPTLNEVFNYFKQLLERWPNDFLDNWDKAVIEGEDDQEKLKLANHCREIFDSTTDYFSETSKFNDIDAEDGKPAWTDASGGQFNYVNLVAGHCIMAYHSVDAALKNLDERRQKFRDTKPELRKRHKEEIAWNNWDIAYHGQYFIGIEYAARVRAGEHNVVGYLRSKGVKWHADHIEAAWWVMMLRGIVWDMSTSGDPNFRGFTANPLRWRGSNVPSSFYDLRTPVWIN
jgi:hypothetical protein